MGYIHLALLYYYHHHYRQLLLQKSLNHCPPSCSLICHTARCRLPQPLPIAELQFQQVGGVPCRQELQEVRPMLRRGGAHSEQEATESKVESTGLDGALEMWV